MNGAVEPSGFARPRLFWVWPALLFALAALAGSLWLSIAMGLKACPLCFYQRTFVMAVVAVLGAGLLIKPSHRAVLTLLVLPMVVAAFAVALFHVYLELTGKLECPKGIAGLGSAPQQSFAALAALLAVIMAGVVQGARAGEFRKGGVMAVAALGCLLAWAAVASSPPMPPTPSRPYAGPPDICRPPYRP
jgi:disulfide bond formation protein DsbB